MTLLDRPTITDALRHYQHARAASDLAFDPVLRLTCLVREGKAARALVRVLLAAVGSTELPPAIALPLDEYRRLASEETADVLAIPVAAAMVLHLSSMEKPEPAARPSSRWARTVRA